jgi:hypothetical protein
MLNYPWKTAISAKLYKQNAMTDIEVQFIKTGTGEVFTIGPITVRVLEDGSHTDNRVGAVEIIVPPIKDQTPLHLHM